MLNWYARRRRSRRTADLLYGAIVALSRRPELYLLHGVPDTLAGRFEVLSAHMYLFLERLRLEGEEQDATAQALVDRFFGDMDVTQREAGVGDLAVPKSMRKLAVHFDARMRAYAAAMEAEEDASLEALVADAFFPGQECKTGDPAGIASYLRRARHLLAGLKREELESAGALCDALWEGNGPASRARGSAS
ncbi:MAG: ubiquinol-cytochrome C chaperone [Alphaproteobacteria bacterium]|nr:MAG: ubiquinol-cytochrome C chaperone [Alphaproteobacteria bacterium]